MIKNLLLTGLLAVACWSTVSAQVFNFPGACAPPDVINFDNPQFVAEATIDGVEAPIGLEVGVFNSSDQLIGKGFVEELDFGGSTFNGFIITLQTDAQGALNCPTFTAGEMISVRAAVPAGIADDASSPFAGTVTFNDPLFFVDGPDGDASTNDVIDFQELALPVTLLQFNARLVDRKVELTWATSEEVNNSHFEVERSTNPNDGFVNIGKVLGNATTEELNTYRFLDGAPEEGPNYYRLKQIDFDGNFEYTPIVIAELEEASEKMLSVFPNPVELNDRVTIRLNGGWANEGTTLQLFEAGGRMVAEWTNLSNGSLNMKLPALPAGLYQLVATDGNDRKTTRLVVR
ncbi:T9SS type A sorting domain-containing protein [Lewinella sp. W8]|uniref:T9SS type A sorting domain-containing protein n=1 Tax=Lewinella sp. W8 TaxID=2528208 RepID=UPI00106826F7|nr:T9SS type A sorting domain-containing protein [Lewinella sp. W8]MTB52840.1 T9SS type A sorting domain-containing protein [Lewinella sp. W8]